MPVVGVTALFNSNKRLTMNKTITLLIIGVIFLALALIVLNSFMVEERHGAPASLLSEKTRLQENGLPVSVEQAPPAPVSVPPAREAPASAALSVPKAASQPPESAAAGRNSSTEGVTVKTVPAQIDAGQASPASLPPPMPLPSRPTPPKAPALPEPGAKQTNGGAKNITHVTVYATQEGATLRLSGNKPLVYKSMVLQKPDRFVLDVEGQWNMELPSVPQNKIVKAVRVGRQADSTRIVVDLHRAPAAYRLVKTSPQKLDVRLR